MKRSPHFIVVDLETLDSQTRQHLLIDRDGVYDGPLSSDVLAHLAHCAREREAFLAARLAAVLDRPTIGGL